MNLVVMAAGMGSRFGGLKQLTPVGPSGEFLIDYSVYDAMRAGVDKVIFIIRREHYELFRDTIGKRLENVIKVEYAFQDMDDLPIELESMPERKKPWGTGHALLAARDYVDSNFMIINADDFYGREAFETLGKFLKTSKTDDMKHYAMVGYYLINTLSDNGTVSRGVCEVENGYLKKIVERTKIGYSNDKLVYFEDDKEFSLDIKTQVSCNLFGFSKEIFEDAKEYFIDFLNNSDNLESGEFYLPTVARRSIEEGRADLKFLETDSMFFGMTYREDLEGLKQNIEKLIEEGVYPSNLWEEVE